MSIKTVFDMKFEYTLIRSDRKSLAVEVSADCKITVRAPMKLSQKKIDAFLLEKKSWLEKTIIKQMEKAKSKKVHSPEEIEALRKKAKDILPKKVEYYSALMGVKPSAVKINSAKKRYGSCSAKNSLNFSLFLMERDERFIDYVVVHELAHIKHHNHSKEFYSFVEQFMPDYKERLKEV